MSNIQLTDDMMLDLWRLQCFVAVAETEHVGAAAESLHISPSPLSRQIRQLEDELGVKLFERRGKRLQITSNGREFLRLSRELLERANRVERDGKRLASPTFGPVTIGYIQEAILSGVLPSALRFIEGETKITPVLKQMRTQDQLASLEKSQIDIGILSDPPTEDHFESRLIAEQNYHVVFSEKHRLSRVDVVDLEHLANEAWVGPSFDIWMELANIFSHHGKAPPIAYETLDIAASLALVADGIGFTIVPSNMCRMLSKKFKTTKFPISSFILQLHAVCLAGANNSATNYFIDVLKDR
jgi:DNA-binding transcriptional LysR family regulator